MAVTSRNVTTPAKLDPAKPGTAPTRKGGNGSSAKAPDKATLKPPAKGASAKKAANPGKAAGLSDEDLIEMYRLVALARAVDERMWILNRSGRIPFVISGQGHEGAQVGITWALRRDFDWIAPFYRSIATCLTFGMGARDILMAQYAKATDPSSGGRQMPGHYGDRAHNLLSVSSPVATQVLHAVGIALAAKIRKTGQVALTSMGEGSSNQGDVHEALNFAAIHKLPFVLVVENNGYAISVPSSKELALPDVAARASGYGIPGVIVDGSDVIACYQAARTAVERARAGEGPTLIEAKVMRLTGHSSDDQQTKYRSEEELAGLRSRDPLTVFRESLRSAGVLDEAIEDRLGKEIKAIVDEATEFAEAQPDPDPSTGMRWVFAEDWPSETPPAWGFGDRHSVEEDTSGSEGVGHEAEGGTPEATPSGAAIPGATTGPPDGGTPGAGPDGVTPGAMGGPD
jgi:2-oxoisovalerate dehydrogenase E1 component alpha subunit